MAERLLATQISTKFSSTSSLISLRRHRRNLLPFGYPPRLHIRRRLSSDRISPPRASSESQTQEDDEGNGKPMLVFQEDLSFLVKLGGGSLAGAAAIKYGSIVFPEIARPNIGQALFMISAPVAIAVLLLIKQSRRPS